MLCVSSWIKQEIKVFYMGFVKERQLLYLLWNANRLASIQVINSINIDIHTLGSSFVNFPSLISLNHLETNWIFKMCILCYAIRNTICADLLVMRLLFFRCGHMCTCYKCAYELQWSSGICPICRAPIVDVVRTYSDT